MSGFAQATFSLEGVLAADDFPRFVVEDGEDADSLGASLAGPVTARVRSIAADRGSGAAAERPGFTVEARATLRLTCQSCAVRFERAVDASSTLWVARDERQMLDWEHAATRSAGGESDLDSGVHGAAGFEVVLAGELSSALELVEDELLLAVPVAPRCDACRDEPQPRVFSFGPT